MLDRLYHSKWNRTLINFIDYTCFYLKFYGSYEKGLLLSQRQTKNKSQWNDSDKTRVTYMLEITDQGTFLVPEPSSA